MERLRAEDRQSGKRRAKPLTEQQKLNIAELRRSAKAKLAELEILHRDKIAAAGGDPAEIERLEERFQIDRRRVESKLESDIARVKRGEDPRQD